MSVLLWRLRLARRRVAVLEADLEMERSWRDRLALQAIERGNTWREVAEAAGFANPYIAHLKRRQAQTHGGSDE